MITLTAEQAQQIEEALEDIVRVFKFETGTPVEALAVIRAARAQGQAEQEPVVRNPTAAEVKAYRDKHCISMMAAKSALINEQALKNKTIEQSPVAEVILRYHPNGFGRVEECKDIVFLADVEVGTKLYAVPVQQVDLTPYEITALILDGAAGGGWQGFAQRVIAKFKEKNK